MAHSNFLWSYLDGIGAMGNDFLFLNFNWRIITLQYCGVFVIHWHVSTCVLSSWTPSHFPPHSITLGCPRALFHASNLHWSSILDMIIHMFQCYSLIASPTLAFSHMTFLCKNWITVKYFFSPETLRVLIRNFLVFLHP